MIAKQIRFRVDEATAAQLELRANIEQRPVNDIIRDAIRDYIESHAASRYDMLKMARAIVKEDAALLKSLADT